MYNEKINSKLIEIPIYFKDRNKGKSKIQNANICEFLIYFISFKE